MCMTVKEMNETMEAIQEWKRVKEEAESNITALNMKVIEFLEATEGCQSTDKKGNPILKFIGSMCKATYSWTSRETVDKEKVKEILSDTEYQKVTKVSTYPVLKIS